MRGIGRAGNTGHEHWLAGRLQAYTAHSCRSNIDRGHISGGRSLAGWEHRGCQPAARQQVWPQQTAGADLVRWHRIRMPPTSIKQPILTPTHACPAHTPSCVSCTLSQYENIRRKTKKATPGTAGTPQLLKRDRLTSSWHRSTGTWAAPRCGLWPGPP